MRSLLLMSPVSAASAVLACALLSACAQDGIEETQVFATLDENFYRCEVQPVLAARCSFMACHGNAVRPLSLFAEQRYRLGVSWIDYQLALTPEEYQANFAMVSGFIGVAPSATSLLLQKPLDTRAGGFFHGARGQYGNDDVFVSRDDVGYRVLHRFIAGNKSPADCVEREEVSP